jgi:hypothetical protein
MGSTFGAMGGVGPVLGMAQDTIDFELLAAINTVPDLVTIQRAAFGAENRVIRFHVGQEKGQPTTVTFYLLIWRKIAGEWRAAAWTGQFF